MYFGFRYRDHANENLEATLTMIEQKSKTVLTSSEHKILQGEMIKYANRLITLANFLDCTSKIMNSPHKVSGINKIHVYYAYATGSQACGTWVGWGRLDESK